MAGLDISVLGITGTDLSDITLDGIFAPRADHGVMIDLGFYDIGLLLSGAPISEPAPVSQENDYKDGTVVCDTPGGYGVSPSGSHVEDLLSAACRAADVDISGGDSHNSTASIPTPPSPPGVQSPEPESPQTLLSPISPLTSTGAHTPPNCIHGFVRSSPSSSDSGYSSSSSGSDPSSPGSDPDFPMPVSPTPSCFDESMPEEEAPLKPSRPGPMPVKKPTDNYIALIGKAILSAPGRRMILSDIINYILQEFPYYRTAPATWKTAIRHNLSVNVCFVKNGKADSGRGYYWSIHRACLDTFLKGDFRRSNARRLVQLMEKAKATAMNSGIAARNNRQSVMGTSTMIGARLAGNVMSSHLNPSSYGQYSSIMPHHSSTAHPASSRGGHPAYPHHPQIATSTQPPGYSYASQHAQVYPIYRERKTGHTTHTTCNGPYPSSGSNGFYQNYCTGQYN